MPPIKHIDPMPAVAIKISEELANVARVEAAHTDRSLTGQIEHWSKIGRAVEQQMTTPVVTALKVSNGNLDLIEDLDLRRQVNAAFEAFQRSSAEQKRSRIGLEAQTRFEPDPETKGGVIRITPDGQRTRGRMNGRVFVPAEA